MIYLNEIDLKYLLKEFIVRILVTVKSVLDPFLTPELDAEHAQLAVTGQKHCMNPYDEVALEQALKFKDAGLATEVIALTIGTDEQVLRTALAVGVDRALIFKADKALGHLARAEIMAKVAQENEVDLVLMGKQSTDFENGILPSMLAEMLKRPHAVNARKIEVEGRTLNIEAEADEGVEFFKLALPAVVSADLRLAKLRFVAMPKLIQARRKPLEDITYAQTKYEEAILQKCDQQEKQRQQHICQNIDEFAQQLKQHLNQVK